jgi:hypothetical protein
VKIRSQPKSAKVPWTYFTTDTNPGDPHPTRRNAPADLRFGNYRPEALVLELMLTGEALRSMEIEPMAIGLMVIVLTVDITAITPLLANATSDTMPDNRTVSLPYHATR